MGTLSVDAKKLILDAWGDAFDLSGTPATLVFETAAHAAVATIELNDDAFAVAAEEGQSVVIYMNTDPDLADLSCAGNASPVTHVHLKSAAGTVYDTLLVDDAEGEGIGVVLTSLIYAATEKLFLDSGAYSL